jgi:4-hydroxyacetophenone monooxygenase
VTDLGHLQPAADTDPSGTWLKDAVEVANIPTLLALLVQMTGELRWLDPPYQPTRNRGLGDNDDGGLPDTVQDEIRAAAVATIRRWQADGWLAIPEPPRDLLLRIMTVIMGEPVPAEYAPMMAAELSAPAAKLTSAPLTPPAAPAPPPGFRVLIIGGGVSGICAARYLTAAGIPCLMTEKSPSLGGTWYDNHYPGAGVDTPSHLYSFSFAKNDWGSYFSPATDIRHYLENVAAGLGEGCEIWLGTEVLRAAYQPAAQQWEVELRGPDGRVRHEHASVVISAVGALNRPVLPRIEGLDRFRGPSFHTARWPADLDVRGKRVAVIGSGASAMQIVPAIKDTVAGLTIFQRSPQWAVPFEKFQQEIPAAIRALFRAVPLYERWYRLRLSWTFNDKIHTSLQRDPGWEAESDGKSINAVNDAYRRFFTRYIRAELGDREDLLPAVLPGYPPFLKRMLLDNGWFRALTEPHVHLITDPIARVTADEVVTTDGVGAETAHPADVLVLATGFDAIHFLASLEVTGRDGQTLRQAWDGDDARAYLGTAVPGFPNFFTMYGPNLQPGHGGSLMFIFECQMNYIVDLLQQMLRHDAGAVECRKDAYDRYNRGVDQAHAAMVWTHPGASTYYRNSRGRVVVNNPHRVIDYWHMTRHADLTDYIVEPQIAGRRAPGAAKTPLAEP